MTDGYMDAAGIPDAGDDTLRLEIAAALMLHDHPERNALTRPKEPLEMLREHPTFFVCARALARADALLPRIREHVASAVQAERERLATAFNDLGVTYPEDVARGLAIAALITRKSAEADHA